MIRHKTEKAIPWRILLTYLGRGQTNQALAYLIEKLNRLRTILVHFYLQKEFFGQCGKFCLR